MSFRLKKLDSKSVAKSQELVTDSKSTFPSPRRYKGIFLALNFCFLTDYQKLWYTCFLFVKTSFDPN